MQEQTGSSPSLRKNIKDMMIGFLSKLHFKKWINRNAQTIIALAALGSFLTTVVLALFAYLSWTTVQNQIDLAFKQFAIANAPSVRVYATDRLQVEENFAKTSWKAENLGGPIEKVKYKSILFSCDFDEKGNANLGNFIIRSTIKDKLERNETQTFHILTQNPDRIKWLKARIKDTNYGIYLYVCTDYFIPEEINVTGMEMEKNTYRLVRWDSFRVTFINVKPSMEKKILASLEKHPDFTLEYLE